MKCKQYNIIAAFIFMLSFLILNAYNEEGFCTTD